MAKRPSKKAEESGLLSALKFIQVAQQEVGTTYQTHCRFLHIGEMGAYVVAFDGVLAAGHPVTEEPPVCPHTYRLIDALERVGGAMSMTVLDTGKLVIKTDKFRAMVSCVGDGDLTYSWPDRPQWPMSDDFKKAANIASIFNTDGAQTVMGASVVTRDGSIIGTNGQVAIEAWHGIPTPPNMIIPKGFITAIMRVTKPITRFGYSDGSLTVWFDGGAWIKTQLYLEQYPDVNRVLAQTESAKPMPMPKELFDAIKAVLPFAESPRLWLGDSKVRSHEQMSLGATYECAPAIAKVSINGKQFVALQEVMTQIDFTSNEQVFTFFGDKVRGAMSRYNDKTTEELLNDKIPF